HTHNWIWQTVPSSPGNITMFGQSSQTQGSSAQPHSSLFGGTLSGTTLGTSSTSQPQTTGLFSGLGTSTTSSQPPPPRNMFAGFGSIQPASSQNPPVFNIPPTSTQPQQ